MVAQVKENPLDCGSQIGKAKSRKGRLLPGSPVSSGKPGLAMTTGGMSLAGFGAAVTFILPPSRRNFPVS